MCIRDSRRTLATSITAATTMAAAARMHFAVNELNAAIAAATTLAAAWRGEAARVQLEVQHTAATTMQAAARALPCRRNLATSITAATTMAAAARTRLAVNQLHTALDAAVSLPATLDDSSTLRCESPTLGLASPEAHDGVRYSLSSLGLLGNASLLRTRWANVSLLGRSKHGPLAPTARLLHLHIVLACHTGL